MTLTVMDEARKQATALATLLSANAERMTPEQRMEIFNIVQEDWCKLCGGLAGCMCAPCYDD